MRKRAVFMFLAVFVAFAELSYAQNAIVKPVVAVHKLQNTANEKTFDVICSTVSDVIRLTLELMGKYRIVKTNGEIKTAGLDDIRAYASQANVDNVIYGRVFVDDMGHLAIEVSIYDKFEDRVIIEN